MQFFADDLELGVQFDAGYQQTVDFRARGKTQVAEFNAVALGEFLHPGNRKACEAQKIFCRFRSPGRLERRGYLRLVVRSATVWVESAPRCERDFSFFER